MQSARLLTPDVRATNSSATDHSNSSSGQQCQWFEAPVTRSRSRQRYQPVHWLARHWVLSGRQFDLSDIADVLVDNATALLVSSSIFSIICNANVVHNCYIAAIYTVVQKKKRANFGGL